MWSFLAESAAREGIVDLMKSCQRSALKRHWHCRRYSKPRLPSKSSQTGYFSWFSCCQMEHVLALGNLQPAIWESQYFGSAPTSSRVPLPLPTPLAPSVPGSTGTKYMDIYGSTYKADTPHNAGKAYSIQSQRAIRHQGILVVTKQTILSIPNCPFSGLILIMWNLDCPGKRRCR